MDGVTEAKPGRDATKSVLPQDPSRKIGQWQTGWDKIKIIKILLALRPVPKNEREIFWPRSKTIFTPSYYANAKVYSIYLFVEINYRVIWVTKCGGKHRDHVQGFKCKMLRRIWPRLNSSSNRADLIPLDYPLNNLNTMKNRKRKTFLPSWLGFPLISIFQ